jgi:integrase
MASFRRIPSGLWQAQIVRRGVRLSKTFTLKTAALVWAQETEASIINGETGHTPDKTFGDLLEKYSKQVSPTKRGSRWEVIRIQAIGQHRIAQVRLKALNATHVAQWRDERLKTVSSATVRRDWNLLSHACEIARKEWRWIKTNPFRDLKRPPASRHRTRIFTNDDIKALERVSTTDHRKQVMRLIYFCIETGMRAGEACGLREIRGNVAYLDMTKNGQSREVPLSKKAIELFNEGWSLNTAQLDASFRQMKNEAGLEDLHFHDTRRTAITNLSKKLDVLELARMVGHTDIKELLTYYRASASDIAGKL